MQIKNLCWMGKMSAESIVGLSDEERREEFNQYEVTRYQKMLLEATMGPIVSAFSSPDSESSMHSDEGDDGMLTSRFLALLFSITIIAFASTYSAVPGQCLSSN
jgi:hypothetical protein